MNRRIGLIIIIFAVGTVSLLGIFVNSFFFYLVFLMCPLMHLVGTCEMDHEHEKKQKKKTRGRHRIV